ncbi:MAG: hypothetical protein ACP5G2_04765 [Candidatus Bipolaricaulaceae bacterium]
MDLLGQIAYHPLGGFPVIFYLGILSYAGLLATSVVMVLTRRKIVRIPFKCHHWLAYLTVALATLHGLLSVSAYV